MKGGESLFFDELLQRQVEAAMYPDEMIRVHFSRNKYNISTGTSTVRSETRSTSASGGGSHLVDPVSDSIEFRTC